VNQFLNDIKEDLRDRRLLPWVVLAGALMVGALAFAVLGGGSSSSTPAAVGPHRPAGSEGGIAVVAAHSLTALAETTSGAAEQHQGSSRDPFSLLPGAVVPGASAAGSSSKGSGSESSSGSSKGNASTSGGSAEEGKEPSSGSKSGGSGGNSQPPKPKTVYQTSVLFGEPSSGAAGEESKLKPYENLKLLTPLPSSAEPLLVFRGVSSNGKLATFTVAGETILHGNGKCLPSAYQCQAIQLRAGQREQLQYLPPSSNTVQSYELRLVSITPVQASAAQVASLWRGESQDGMQVLRRANLVAIPGLGYSTLAGVLVASS
jgi:hypothetical protein